jgi:hypothetical protein
MLPIIMTSAKIFFLCNSKYTAVILKKYLLSKVTNSTEESPD